MRALVYTEAAKQDLLEILDYIATESENVTVGLIFTTHLREQCRKLAELPGTLGRARPELRPDIRSFAYKGYVIFFRYFPEMLEIVNILEGHRDIESYFAEKRL
jgi:toxin ParE1/3/4